jgi:hypothetical protein
MTNIDNNMIAETKKNLEILHNSEDKLKEFSSLNKEIFYSRHNIIEWYLQIKEKLNLSEKTLHRAMTIFDEYVSIMNNKYSITINLNDLQKISFVCFYISFKLEEPYSMSIEYIQKNVLNETFTVEELKKLEYTILKTLKFKLNRVNIYSFFESFSEFIFLLMKDYKGNQEKDMQNSANNSAHIDKKLMMKNMFEINSQVMIIISTINNVLFDYENSSSNKKIIIHYFLILLGLVYGNNLKSNSNDTKISELAVISLKVSLLFYKTKLNSNSDSNCNFGEWFRTMDRIVNNHFNIILKNSEKIENINRQAIQLYNFINQIIDKEDKLFFRKLKCILNVVYC